MNRGAYLLRRTGAGLDAVGAACGVSGEAARLWRNAKKKPAAGARAKLREAYDIPEAAWDEAVDETTEPVAKPDMPSVPPPDVVDALDLKSRSLGAAYRADYLERELQATLTFLASDRKTTPVERMKALSQAAGIEEKIAKLRGELELTNTRIVQLPFWRRICERSATTLAQWPDAARAFADMVRQLEHEAQVSVEPAKVA